ncbi:MAG: translation initiation factor IF-3 [Dehalococcoidales bacterium]|nr:translation initiation factor IF-3 [Dehalococcoidales bacterium]MDD5605571.1 translation initiation factor IF-3 [Dehalococcoidales bacterium]MDX9986548.1 translation initiation factor IF-3 [Dehalococcoidales bacterium]
MTNIIKELRVNEKIRGKEVRVVGEKGEQLGILTVAQALEAANRYNLDLVEVAPTAVPPVCRLMDYGKFKYEQTKKEREAKRNQKQSLLREIRLRPKIGEHDFESKAKIARKLLEDGDKVKVTIMFRGRENAHPELGIRLIGRMAERLSEVASVERDAIREGGRLHAILSPLPNIKPKVKEGIKEKDAEVKNAQGS